MTSGEKLQELYMDALLDRITSVRYPSGELLDRAENLVHSRRHAERLLTYLIETVDKARYPSHQLLDRIERILYGTSGRYMS